MGKARLTELLEILRIPAKNNQPSRWGKQLMLSNVCIFVVWDLSLEGMLKQIMSVLRLGTELELQEGDQTGEQKDISVERDLLVK